LGAAWALSKTHDVVLFESEPKFGGHACSIDIEASDGTAQLVDIGFLVFNEWWYPNFCALLDTLRVRSRPVPSLDLSVQFRGGAWRTGHDTPFWRGIADEAARFHLAMPEVAANPVAYTEVTIDEWLDQNGYSNEFRDAALAPLLSTLFLTRTGLPDSSIFTCACFFGPVPILSLLTPVGWRTVEGGSRSYIDAILNDFRGELRPSSAVQRIHRKRDHVQLVVAGRTEAFDHVVLATPANISLSLLADPSETETTYLGDVTYDDAHVVLHRDARVMPTERRLWAAFNFVTDEASGPFRQGSYSYFCSAFQPWVDQDVFVTVGPRSATVPLEARVSEHRWHHRVPDFAAPVRSRELRRIQGKRRTWYCGEHTSLIGAHEGSFISGLAVAVALGAPYPFPKREAATRLFEDSGAEHAGLTSSTRKEGAIYWPPRPGALVGQMLAESIAKRARGPRDIVPERLARLASRLVVDRLPIYRSLKTELTRPHGDVRAPAYPRDTDS
jgi:predicted NAD/FAD-binding protein